MAAALSQARVRRERSGRDAFIAAGLKMVAVDRLQDVNRCEKERL